MRIRSQKNNPTVAFYLLKEATTHSFENLKRIYIKNYLEKYILLVP